MSDGAGIALSFLPLARTLGIPTHYIESAARIDGVSLTGRILEHIGKIHLYTQHREAMTPRWRFGGSVFDSFAPEPIQSPKALQKLVVTVGTLDLPFRRLFDRLKAVIPESIDVLAQAGPLAGSLAWANAEVLPDISSHDLRVALAQADVVICHAGVGSILMALDAGHVPVVVPRAREYGEHVDDHQAQVARQLAASGLVHAVCASDLISRRPCDRSRTTRCPCAVPRALHSGTVGVMTGRPLAGY